jgi:hypothetical protein
MWRRKAVVGVTLGKESPGQVEVYTWISIWHGWTI